MRTRKPDPNTRNRSASLWSKSTLAWVALCLHAESRIRGCDGST